MSKAIHRIILLLIIAASSLPVFSQLGKISIEIANIRSEKGLIRLALYDHKDQFPNDPSRFYDFEKTFKQDGSMYLELVDIPQGIYVISVLDDEDENDKMKFNLLRMPREGYGFSNNIKPRHKSPPYEECSFQIDKEIVYLKIEIQYFREKS